MAGKLNDGEARPAPVGGNLDDQHLCTTLEQDGVEKGGDFRFREHLRLQAKNSWPNTRRARYIHSQNGCQKLSQFGDSE